MSQGDTIRFDDQVVIITGAGGGLGRAYAHLLADRGAKVVVNDPGSDVHGSGQNRGPADEVVKEICELGGEATANYDSVTTVKGGAAIVAAALNRFGRLDGLIHNAGILRDKSFLKLCSEDLEAVLDVHLRGAFFVTQPAFRIMKEQRYGRIVFTTSASGLFGNFGQSNYGAAKTSLLGLMRVLSVEGASHGIHVNCVAPSARTRMTKELLGPLSDQLDPRHVAPLMAYLCCRQCNFTSEVFSAGGGRFARVFLGLTDGWYNRDGVCSIEELAERMEVVMDTDNFSVPHTGMDELQIMLDTFGVSQQGE